MPQQSYDLNDTARLSVNFKVNGVLTNPTTISATVRKPDGTTAVYTTATSPAIVNDGTGLYHLDVVVDQAGQWTYKFVGTGAAADVGPGVLYVRPDPTASSDPRLYVPLDALKATLKIVGTDSDPNLAQAIESASRAIDYLAGRRFYPDTTVRYYTADYTSSILDVGDIQSVSSLTVDADGDGTYETTWVENTDFYLAPLNQASVYGEPFTDIELLAAAGQVFPSYQRGVRVAGTFGWTSPPAGVRSFTEILASRILKRATDAPYGFVLSGNDLGSITRIVQRDPDFELLVGPYVRGGAVAVG